MTAAYLFPTKFEKPSAKEAREFRERFEAVPGYDPVAASIDQNSIGHLMKNGDRIDRLAKPSMYDLHR
jgi:hypothetical protein